MPKDNGLKKVLMIGSGPIVIGQGAEFDYAGAQACKALREEGLFVVLVNSNPATIMTDEEIADRVYLEPLTVEALEAIIAQEKPDGVLATLGGQTGLNLALALDGAGILQKYGVRLLGTSLKAIKQAEDREAFRQLMHDLKEPVAKSQTVNTLKEASEFSQTLGFPLIVRPAYTLGGTGGGIAHTHEELLTIVQQGFLHSPIHQVLLEENLTGWKEVEYEVMRDSNGTGIVVCNMENFDPVGIHTGDSIVVAPSQTLRDEEYHMLRTSALKIIEALKIEGGCNVQFALSANNLDYRIIEVNPRVSRSSALASKAAGYPIAKVAAKIAIGLHLHEIPNAVTGKTCAAFEPALDYIVTKIPKWPFDKFPTANRKLGTQMKATGEVMAIERTFERSLLKAIAGLDNRYNALLQPALQLLDIQELMGGIEKADDQRLFMLAEAFRRGVTVETLASLTQIDRWFLSRLQAMAITADALEKAETGNAPDTLFPAQLSEELLHRAKHLGLLQPEAGQVAYKMVDSCAGEFEAETPYYYATMAGNLEAIENENIPSDARKILVLGSGPIRIGQGIEFDYCAVHAALSIRDAGYEALMLNNNPETVSTDFDTADKLFFEPVTMAAINEIIAQEKPEGVVVQFGGQTAMNLVHELQAGGIRIFGTSPESIDIAEDRKRFIKLLDELEIPYPKGYAVSSLDELLLKARDIGYPVLVRPSYVIGGRDMRVIQSETELVAYGKLASFSFEKPLLVDQYICGMEVEVDAISDGEDILIPGLMEHIERAGVHSGDSFSVYPTQNVSEKTRQTLVTYTAKIAKALKIIGLMNIQFVVSGDKAMVLELNPRASRTVPILSKVTGIPMVPLAISVMLGKPLQSLGYGTGLAPLASLVAVKAPVFSFQKFKELDVAMSPEMKSTGEVLGVDATYEKALAKAFLGAGYKFPKAPGNILVSLNANDYQESLPLVKAFSEAGYQITATPNTATFLTDNGLSVQTLSKKNPEQLQQRFGQREFSVVINTPSKGHLHTRAGFQMRMLAELYRVPCFTCLDTAKAYIQAWQLLSQCQTLSYQPIQDYEKCLSSPLEALAL
ncbi:MAG: carbamoyl-phosphate synthase (glutamine-hydrolyzing) large subunit [Vampirovibrionales bacterium]|nr:carbamoyl-phosphate synthase (glutamine-hydrolyzing) large subunit [Vampirovibrionales bacterium]